MASKFPTFNTSVTTFMLLLLLIPHEFDFMTSNAQPVNAVDIIKALNDAQNFKTISSLITSTGVISQLNADQRGAGVTLLVPTDNAFRKSGIPAGNKATLVKFHVLHAYYAEKFFKLLKNPLHPTLATEERGPGRLTLAIANGTIDTGIVKTTVGRTIFDRNPVAIYEIPAVLLPREPL